MELDDYFTKGSEAWEAGKLSDAFALFLKGAELGDWASQISLAIFYDVGDGTKKDRNKALFWYKKALQQDYQSGICCNIASLYASEANHRQAVFWWQKAINLSDGEAMLALGTYLLKRNEKRYQTKAFKLFKQASQSSHISELGREMAWSNMAAIYAKTGKHRQALYWWQKAFDSGNDNAAVDLACYLLQRNKKKYLKDILYFLTIASESESEYLYKEKQQQANKLLAELKSCFSN